MESASASAQESSATLIERCRREYAATLDRLLPAGADVVLLDYPSHRNVGDHLIWLGETKYLAGREDLRLHWLSDRFSYSHRALSRRLPAGAIVLLHGGGNFGDVYPQVQRSREAIVEQFHGHRFIQLPQTVSFASRDSARASAAVLGRHPDFTLLARDGRSLEVARDLLACPVELCVDAAFMLGPQRRPAAPAVPIRWIARRDEESVNAPGRETAAGVEVFDWVDVEFDEAAWRRSYRLHRAFAAGLAGARAQRLPLGPLSSRFVGALDGPSRRHAEAGLAHVAGAEVLVTDRLHGHLMALLLDLPHVVLDSVDSKVANFYATWTQGAARAHWADDPATALALAQRLLAEERAR